MSLNPEEIHEITLTDNFRAALAAWDQDPHWTVLKAQIDMAEQDVADLHTKIDQAEHRRANPEPTVLTDEQWMSIAEPIALKAAQEAALGIVACLNR
jgi:hypothetical protein